jgi:hypothetical protein
VFDVSGTAAANRLLFEVSLEKQDMIVHPARASDQAQRPLIWMSAGLIGGIVISTAAMLAAFMRMPFVPGDLAWVIFYLALSAAVLVLYLRGQRAVLVRAGSVGLGVTLGAALIFSPAGPDLAALAWLAALAAGIGSLLLHWLGLTEKEHLAERLLMSLALGIGALALLAYALGSANVYAGALGLPVRFFKLLHPIPVFLSLIVLSALVLPPLIRSVRPALQSRMAARQAWYQQHEDMLALILPILWICGLGVLPWALSPSIRFDSLVYHLAAPQRYMAFRGILEVTEPMHFYMSHYAEMLFTLALVVAGQPLPSLLHLLAGLVTLGLTVVFAARLGYPHLGWLAGLFFVTLPIFYDAGTAHNDYFVSMFSFASFLALLCWYQEGRRGWLLVGGVLAGLSIGTKINAAMPALAAGLALVWVLAKRRASPGAALRDLAAYGLPVLALYVPWAMLNSLWLGDPLYPFFCSDPLCASLSQAAGPAGGEISPTGGPAVGGLLGRFVYYFFYLPWIITVHGDHFYIENFGGAAGAIFLASLPWFLLARREDPEMAKTAVGLSVFSALNFLLLLPFSHRLRYMLPVLPVLCILAAINLSILWRIAKRSVHAQSLYRVGMAVLALYFFATRLVFTTSGWQLPARYPLEVAFGLEQEGAFLSRTIPAYDALQYLDTQPDGYLKVASIGDETRIYTGADVHTFYYSHELPFILETSAGPEQIAAGLRTLGYRYILYDHGSVTTNALPVDRRLVEPAFLDRYTRLVFTRNDVYLYRLFPEPHAAAPLEGQNLIQNGDLEQADGVGAPDGWQVYNTPVYDRGGDQAHTGDGAVLASDEGYIYQRTSVQGGALYTLGHWSRGENADSPVRLQIIWLDRRTLPIEVTIRNLPGNEHWSWNQFSISAPDDAAVAQIVVTSGENPPAWFDDICFVQGPSCVSAANGAPEMSGPAPISEPE